MLLLIISKRGLVMCNFRKTALRAVNGMTSDGAKLAIRTVIFLVLVPGSVTVLLPLNFYRADHAAPEKLGWLRFLGWAPIAAGILLLLCAAAEFLLRGRGTPAVWFTEPLRFVLGREPQVLVQGTVYRYTRNPMYVGVLAILFGEALVWASPELLWYAVAACVVFELVVVLVEEPHLRRKRGPDYTRYCGEVPRWLLKLSRKRQ